MNAVIINRNNEILAYIDAMHGQTEAKVAGAITIEGDPANSKYYRVSKSQKNLARAAKIEGLDTARRHEHAWGPFYTFRSRN